MTNKKIEYCEQGELSALKLHPLDGRVAMNTHLHGIGHDISQMLPIEVLDPSEASRVDVHMFEDSGRVLVQVYVRQEDFFSMLDDISLVVLLKYIRKRLKSLEKFYRKYLNQEPPTADEYEAYNRMMLNWESEDIGPDESERKRLWEEMQNDAESD